MSRRNLARDVLSQDELADYEARLRLEAQPMHKPGLPRVSSDGWDQRGEFHGVPGHWDWEGGPE